MNLRAWRRGLLVCGALAAAGAARADFDETRRLSGASLGLANLIGQVQIEPATGSDFEVEIAVRGKDGTRENIKIETDEGNDAVVRIRYPLEDEDTYIYPALGRHTRSSFDFSNRRGRNHGLLSLLFHGFPDQVTVKGHGRGLEVWADVTVRVPDGRTFTCDLGVGEVTASNVRGDLDLTTRCGDLHCTDLTGDLLCDSGSGSIEATGISGDVLLDTGSGSVEASRCKGGDVKIDTGSGNVRMAEIDCEALSVDTGSGGIEGTGLSCGSAMIDTGSGSIGLEFTRIGDGSYVFDTGSGNVDIELPENPSADFVADTGAGNIVIDLGDLSNVRKGDGEASFTVGDGRADFKIDSGSGTIRVSE